MSGSDLREIGVGMLGYGFMGKAHSNAYRKLAYMTWPPPLLPKLIAIFGRTERESGLHVSSPTPARSAICSISAESIYRSGGPTRRSTPGASEPRKQAGRSATPAPMSSTSPVSSPVRSPPSRESCAPSFPAARLMTRSPQASNSKAARSAQIEATRVTLGHKNALQWELNGTKGSIAFDMERLNELQVFRAGSGPARGFETVLVTEPEHPFLEWWWPPGHILGWEHTFVHEIHHLLRAIAENTDVAPLGATFEDGYRAAEVCDAIVRSAETGRREDIIYR